MGDGRGGMGDERGGRGDRRRGNLMSWEGWVSPRDNRVTQN